jgi:beta-phosphoglucomutase-like phosphatase (HAD superfamily)
VTARPPSRLTEIAARSRHLLLDFDGPVCDIFAGTPNYAVAHDFRLALSAAGIVLPDEVKDLGDPLEVFRIIARYQHEAAEPAHRELTRLEFEAVLTAKPTEGAGELMTAARATGRTVTIVSNNSGDAVLLYLDMHQLYQHVTAVIGRDDADPERMKPSPYRVREAVGMLGAEGMECAFVGDSVTDVLAGRLAGVAVIGFANKPKKAGALAHAGANAVTTQLAEISKALRTAPRPALPN